MEDTLGPVHSVLREVEVQGVVGVTEQLEVRVDSPNLHRSVVQAVAVQEVGLLDQVRQETTEEMGATIIYLRAVVLVVVTQPMG
jgi:hypothetical protein